jgi:hypothetical protein
MHRSCAWIAFAFFVIGGATVRSYSIIGALVAAGLFLSACAGLQEVPYDRMSSGQIKTIGIITPSAPKEASIILASSVGQSFGLVGALVDAGLQANRETHFKAVVAKEQFSAQDAFLGRLKEQLSSRGYIVSDISAARPSSKFLDKYPDNANVDAYLDIVVSSYGYVSAGIGSSTPYRPQLMLQVRLVQAKTSQVLMQDTIFYNPVGPYAAGSNKMVTITPAPAYNFVDFDRLEADPHLAVEGLRDATYQSADMVSTLLR